MKRGDRGLDRVGVGRSHARERQPLVNLGAVPACAILVLEQNDFAARGDARVAPRVMQQH